MGLKNLFNLSAESMQKLNAKMADLNEAGGSGTMVQIGLQECVSCKGGACTVGFGGD